MNKHSGNWISTKTNRPNPQVKTVTVLQDTAMDILKTWFSHNCADHKVFLCPISGQVGKSQLPHKVLLFCSFQQIQCLTQGILYSTSVTRSLQVNHYSFTLVHVLVTKDLFGTQRCMFVQHIDKTYTLKWRYSTIRKPHHTSSWRKASYNCNKIEATSAVFLHSLNTAGQVFHSSETCLHSIYLIVETVQFDHV